MNGVLTPWRAGGDERGDLFGEAFNIGFVVAARTLAWNLFQ